MIDCLPKGTIKALRLQRYRASSTASEFTAKVGVADGLTIVLRWGRRRLWRENVYPAWAKRIRFTLETYTFYSRYVYVRTREGTRSTDTSDEVREVGAGGAGEELGRGGGKKGSTVGRIDDPQWV
ncbi:hypothetical protein HMPREF1556_00015, partial [Porphyromonas sp. oral taxon 278 str. W7784]